VTGTPKRRRVRPLRSTRVNSSKADADDPSLIELAELATASWRRACVALPPVGEAGSSKAGNRSSRTTLAVALSLKGWRTE
jgi:hypothetical protein